MRKPARWLAAGSAVLVLLAAASGFLVWRAKPHFLVAFDEAFVAARPALVARLAPSPLELLADPGLLGELVLGPRLEFRRLPLDRAGGALLDILAREKPALVVASPLVARTLVEGAARNGVPLSIKLLAVEWRPAGDQAALPNFANIGSDPRPAYERAGRILAAILDDERRGSAWSGPADEAAGALLLFEPSAERPEALKAGFLGGWSPISARAPTIISYGEGQAGVDYLGAVRSALGGDIRVAFFAAGQAGSPGLAACAKGGVFVALACPDPGRATKAWPFAALAICPDEAATGRAIRAADPAKLKSPSPLPWRLQRLPGASAWEEKGLSLALRLRTSK